MAIILNPIAGKSSERPSPQPTTPMVEPIPWVTATELEEISQQELVKIGFALAQCLPSEPNTAGDAWCTTARIEAVTLSRF